MKKQSAFKTLSLTIVVMIMLAGVSYGQVYKNNGLLRNTGTMTVKEFQNYRTSGGTFINRGTFSTTTSGGGTGKFYNTDSTSLNGTVRNYIGSTGGTMTIVSTLSNNRAGALIDNDSTNSGSILVLGADVSSAAGTIDTDTGKVVYNRAGAQPVYATTYGALVVDGGNTKTVSSAVTVNDSVRIDNSTTLSVSGTTTLTLKGQNTAQNSGVFSPATSTTVNYAGNSNQTIFPSTTYYDLTLSGSTSGHSKTVAGGISFLPSGNLNISTTFDTLEVTSGVLDLTNLANATFTNDAGIRISSVSSPVIPAGITNSVGNWIYNEASSGQTIAAGTYTNLTLRGNAAKNFPSGTVAVTGNYVMEGTVGARNYGTGTFAFAGGSPQTISGLGTESFNALQFSGAGTKSISSGTITANSVTVAASTGAVTNSATSFTINTSGLTINTGSSWTNSASMSITAGGLTNSNLFTQSSGTLTITAGGVTNNTTGSFTVASGAIVNSTGIFTNDGTVVNDGTITVN